MTIKIFTTGGTIDKVYFGHHADFEMGDPQAGGLLERANVTLDYVVESILRKDSLEITDADRSKLRDTIAADPATQVIVTHGTDTMVETGRVLVDIPDKTIVMTGSMYPAQFRDSDAVFNVGAAFTAVQILPPGVYVTINGRVFDPGKARKNVAMKRFEEL